MRTLLTMLGIVIGVGAVIIMVAIGQGARSSIEAQINTLGTNMLVITAGASTAGGVSQGAGTFNRLQIEDAAEKLQREATLITAVSPVISTRTQLIGGAGNWRTEINGVSTDYQVIRDWPLASGTFFTQDDQRALRKVVVLGSTVAEALYAGMDPIGERLQLRSVPFTVIGVLAAKGQTATGTDQDDVVLVPYTTARARLSGRSFIAQILASTASPADIPAAQEEMSAIMRESHKLGDADDDFTIRNQNELAEAATGTTEVMTWLLAAIASVSLLVGGIGIMNIMLVSVTERTREIGIRMAIGARGSDVMVQFLVESIVISLAGGLLGILVGIAGSALVGSLTGWSTETSPQAVLMAVGFSGAVGVFFGFYPARKAASLHPIQALRYE
ncbi:MAG: ABC transporter permease [Gemmatimonadetes bacterium]|nr:ABC transporter permease [Gemmatimonadota bacterium]